MSLFSDLNEVQLLGNVANSPELNYTTSGTPVATLNIAVNRPYRQNDEWKSETTFVPVVLWSKLAEAVRDRVNKGTRVLIKGRISVRSWDDNEGKKHYKTEIVAKDMILIDRYNKNEKQEEPPLEDPVDNTEMVESGLDESIDPNSLPF